MEGFLIRRWDLNLPVIGATSTLGGGATLAACWLHEPQLISNQPMWLGFHTVRDGIDPRGPRFVPRLLELVVEIWKDLLPGDKALSCPGAAGHRRWPERQLPPRAGSMSLSQSATSQLGWGFHTLRVGIDPGDLRFSPRIVGVAEIWKGF